MSLPVWPTGLINHLAEPGSWSYKSRPQTARSDFDAGVARVRRRFTRSSSAVGLSIAMTFFEFELFKTFVDEDLQGGSRWFSMPVFQGSSYRTMEVRFKNSEEPYQTAYRGFDLVETSFELETRDSTTVLSSGAIYLLNLWGPEYVGAFSDRLQVLVNDVYPDIWP